MNLVRGQVVLVDFPFAGGARSKLRPALIVQNDRDNVRLTNTIVAMISSQTRRSSEETQVLIEVGTEDGRQTGLRVDSVIVCANLFTLEQGKILRSLGKMTPTLMTKVESALLMVFGLNSDSTPVRGQIGEA